MTIARHNKSLLCIMLLLLPLHVFAEAEAWADEIRAEAARMADIAATEKRVVLVPFHGEDGDVVRWFQDALYTALREMGHRPEWADMNNLPPGVPPGGFPPFVNPGPSLVGDAHFAITGNTFFNPLSQQWHLRLFLWQTDITGPVFSDDLAVTDLASLNLIMPYMLKWFFSQTGEPEPPALAQHHLLYAGLRIGWTPVIFAPHWGGAAYSGGSAGGFSVAASANLRLLNFQFSNFQFFNFEPHTFFPNFFLGLQLEGIGAWASGAGGSFTLPALLRLTATDENIPWTFSLLWGCYLFFGGEHAHHQSERVPWGVTVGASAGMRQGPGYITMGLRWSGDMFSSFRAATGGYYRRHTITLFVGYEMGFFGERTTGERRPMGNRQRGRPAEETRIVEEWQHAEEDWHPGDLLYAEEDWHLGDLLYIEEDEYPEDLQDTEEEPYL